MPEPILSHEFENGLVLVGEPMASVESAAFSILVPAGSAYDPADRSGLATVTCEMTLRGCGARDSRQFVTDLENLGVQRGESVALGPHQLWAARRWRKTCRRRCGFMPTYCGDPTCRTTSSTLPDWPRMQELRAIEDDPSHKVMLELKRRYYPDPWGRPSEGEQAAWKRSPSTKSAATFKQLFRPNGTIIGVAGPIDWGAIKDLVGELLLGLETCRRR